MRIPTLLLAGLCALLCALAAAGPAAAQPDDVFWPLSASTTPDAVDKPFGFRVLCGNCTDPHDADFHRGLDFKAAYGTAVHAVFGGTVVRLRTVDSVAGDPLSRWGRFVVIALDDIEKSNGEVLSIHKVAYLHLSTVASGLEVGSRVERGAYLGGVGNSGVGINTVHLHLDYYQGSDDEWIRREEARNPFEILPYGGVAPVAALAKVSDALLRLTVDQAAGSLDIVGFEIEHDGVSSFHGTGPIAIDFNEKVGINMAPPEYEDLNPFQGTTFLPRYYRAGHADYRLVLELDGDWSAATAATVTLTTVHGQQLVYTFDLS